MRFGSGGLGEDNEMKKPLADQDMRWMMIHAPDSLTASLCVLSLSMRKVAREFGGMFVPYIAWIAPYIGMEVKQPYRKYLK